MRDGSQNIRILDQIEFRCLRLRVLFDLVICRIRNPPIGDGCGKDRDVGGERGFSCGQHRGGSFHAHDRDTVRRRQMHRARNQRHLRTQLGRRRGDRVALLA